MLKYLFKYILISVIFLVLIVLPDNINSLNQESRKIKTIIIDAGHGGKDPGTISRTGIHEKKIVLNIALKLRDYLKENYDDVNIILTRDKDEFIDVRERAKIANQNKGDLFLSIHCNFKKTEEHDKTGFEVYFLDLQRLKEAEKITEKENKIYNSSPYVENKDTVDLKAAVLTSANFNNTLRFSQIINSELSKSTKLESRGLFQAGFWVLVGASMPSVLVECGYLSNKNDEEYLKSEKGQEEVAKGLYKAVRFFKFECDTDFK